MSKGVEGCRPYPGSCVMLYSAPVQRRILAGRAVQEKPMKTGRALQQNFHDARFGLWQRVIPRSVNNYRHTVSAYGVVRAALSLVIVLPGIPAVGQTSSTQALQGLRSFGSGDASVSLSG